MRRTELAIASLAGLSFFAFGVGISLGIPTLFIVGGMTAAFAAVLWVVRDDR
ncbi:hypothetical protein [Sphingomonas cavernae]|uniref:hypothetical protein n=1 Tax=Sphingomonas cavernae TaxID=2320861 RepID=UPI0016015314|nr:hypothetical protein [Sphingomonas cavernae]